MMILLLIIAGTAVLALSPVSAEKPVVIILAEGDGSYYLGEEVIFRGTNSDSDSTYLFMTGPGISASGGKLTAPHQNVVNGDPGSFDTATTKPDHSWEYTLYTYNLPLDPGSYTIHAVSQPQAKDWFNDLTTYGTTSIIIKKPFISAVVSPSSVPRGQPFTVTGIAEGDPTEVQVWIIGGKYAYNAMVPVNPDASYAFNAGTQIAANLPTGPAFLIVQHPMQNNQHDIVVSGEFVKNLLLNEGGSTDGMNIFKISGTGSLQGLDTVQALIAGISDSNVDDSYTEIPLIVDGTGISAPQAQAGAPTPIPPQTKPSPLQFAPIGALFLIVGIAVWRRR
ncbi:MAG: hypothetical protein M0R30_06240 [Methanoregula sp.]|uniref:hypothetical protein n=1 Tax=Methanoregula sp. TaxID=2052170 RepID=UPI0025D33568|nr:hypothetical protein [Methanoregula sp.]MCK9631226.1 hypothetical protein [Methanoregula sp.]